METIHLSPIKGLNCTGMSNFFAFSCSQLCVVSAEQIGKVVFGYFKNNGNK